jgi:hypothetical protein
MARNNSNKKSTNGGSQLSGLSQLEKRLLLAEARKGLGPIPKNGKQRSRNNGMRRTNTNQSVAGVAYASKQVGRSPNVKQNTSNSCRIQHSELLSSITGTVGFTSQSFALNPGISTSFPWLSVIAQNWEEYRFCNLRFRYVTRSSTANPGSLMMAADFDAADAAPLTEQIMSSYESCVEDAPWKEIMCPLKTQSLQGQVPRHYVRTAALAANLDIKTYDCGNFFIATTDGTAVPWGKLWVDYDVEFFIPQLPAPGVLDISGGLVTAGGVMSAANPLGSVPVADAQNQDITVDNASLLTFTDLGDFVVTNYITGTVISAFTAVFGAGVTSLFQGIGISGGVSAVNIYRVRVTSLVAATMSFSATATTITGGTLNVGEAPANSLS